MSPTYAVIAGAIGMQCIAAAIVLNGRIGDIVHAILGVV